MMNKENKRLLLTVVAAGVMGLGASQSAFAQVDMDVTATVQNSLTAVIDNELTFGTLFVTAASTGASATGVRAPGTAGATNLTTVTANGLTFLSLGGAERGEVTVTIPPNNTTAFNVELAGLGTENTGATCLTSRDDVLVLEHSSGNPAVPGFVVYAWQLAAGPGSTSVVQPTVTGTIEGSVVPAFAGDQATFYLGATIGTECAAGNYEELGNYAGTLTIDVGY